MTPFGEYVRQLRRRKGVTQKEMARALGVSPAWLSALEHGRRGRPNWQFVQDVIGYFNIIWDEADHLQHLAQSSHPRVVVDSAGLAPEATAFANLVAQRIHMADRRFLLRMIDEWQSLTCDDSQPRD